MSDEGQCAQKTAAELDRVVIARQPDRSELDEAIAWRDRYLAWQTDRMCGNGCSEEQIEAMVRKALDMPYAFWMRAMPSRQARLARGRSPSARIIALARVSGEIAPGVVMPATGA